MADKSNKKIKLSSFPSVSSILEDARLKPLIDKWSFAFISSEVKNLTASKKKAIGKSGTIPSKDELIEEIISIFNTYSRDLLKPVINGTGVILHTNLGRAPISSSAYEELQAAVCGYSNLEFDLGDGKRSKRGLMPGKMLAALSGTEAGLVVNNNAAAVFMIVTNLAQGKEVIISRGQLVQIGGGFRIPEIIERSGAILKEVGTTNKTSLNDYRKAIGKNTGLILIVHKSNFIQSGFTDEPEPSRIVELANEKKIPCCYDLGSGLISENRNSEKMTEPTISSGVRSGADIVCFSGDKLLGGPQAGLIVGRAKYISSLAKDPLYRALRPDKLTIGLLEKTLISYLNNKGNAPIWEMASTAISELEKRANDIAKIVNDNRVAITSLKSSFGGGSLPEYEFDSFGIKIKGDPVLLSKKFRDCNRPIIVRSAPGAIMIDLRTVFPSQDKILIEAIKSCL